MDVRYSPDPVAYRSMDTDELRRHFLVDTLFAPDELPMVYSDVDRSITGSAVPVKRELRLVGSKKEMAAEYFLERREIGIINIGGDGSVRCDGKEISLRHRDGLYVGRGTKEVAFSSADPKQPARFYFVSYPAHTEYPTTYAPVEKATPTRLGTVEDTNKRTIYKYILPGSVKSCQLVMGLTELETGRPLFANRDGKRVYSLAEVERERRIGYGWYSYDPREVLQLYDVWHRRWMPDPEIPR
ncbi:MAG: 5-deoxy-glucuronate isomerase [Bacteroidota bacterium]